MSLAPDPVPRPLDCLVDRSEADAPALVLRDRTLSYAGLRERVALLAGWLASRAQAGDRVASWGAKGELTCMLPLAAARAGMVHVPINPLLKHAQAAHILADSGAVLLIGTGARLKCWNSRMCPELASWSRRAR
ncbi:MAG: AMP-binding protein, partial [Alphaproteobacteria bacterium]|nr:AMP-binding protein [Alphaproteobacteria bacterium]